jgi:uncharacterized membrane protein (DUF2068 family)
VDWNLRACGRHGHVTYRPDEPDLAARLHVTTPAGEAWRCLRCGTFVPGQPAGSGAADHAPIVLRGPALRDAVVLRLLAAERAVRGLALLAAAYGVYEFRNTQGSLQRVLDSYLPLLQPIADRIGYDLTESGPVRLLREALALRSGTLFWLGIGILLYGALQLTEAVGLWLMRRWGEYVAVVGTSVFLPVEVYELTRAITVTRVGALLINLAAVAYLVWTKRLFGTRGGKAAHEARLHETSIIEVERAALTGH